MKSTLLNRAKTLFASILFSNFIFGQLNLVQPSSIVATATPWTGVSTPTDLIVDPIITPLTDPTTTTVSSYSDGSGFENVYIWVLTANVITMDFAGPTDISGVAIWNSFASGSWASAFLEPDHSVNLANFEFFSGGVSLGDEDINVLFPDDDFGELYPFSMTYDDVDQIVMTVITNHGGNETAMSEIAFNSTTCEDITTVISSTEICLGEAITLEGTSLTGGVITWDGGLTNGVPFTPAAAGTTTYTASSSSIDDCPFTVDVTVANLPLVTAGVDEPEICIGESVVFTGGGADSYVWDMGVSDGVAFTPMASGTATYTVIGTHAASGCENTASVDVTVNDLPIVTASVDLTEICIGESVVFTGGGADTYLWDMGVSDGVAFTPVAAGLTTYTVTGTDLTTNCENTASVAVNVLSSLSVTASVSDTDICIGESVTLTGAGADIYAWDMGVTDGVAFTPAAPGVYDFNVLGSSVGGGCAGTDMVSVTVHDLPAVNFFAPITQGCAPLTVDFSSMSMGATYNWSFGDGQTGSGASVSHAYNSPGAYDVGLTIISAAGCTNSETITDYIQVEEVPVAGFTYSPTDINIADTRVEFTNTSSGAASYEWNFNDGSALSTVTNPIHNFPVIGNVQYTVSLTATSSFGCQDMIQQVITIKDALYYFIPNAFTPDGDTFNEEFKPMFDAGLDIYDFHMTIYNRWGERIFESYNVAYGWNGTYGGNGEVVEDGTYIWSIQFGETMSDRNHDINGHVTVLK